jgi:large subunit ribosomal protein L18e
MTTKTKTKIESQLKSKTNSELIKTVIAAKKNTAWLEVASLLTVPGRASKDINLTDIEKADGEVIVVCGKVLSQGEITKKVKVAAMKFSENAAKKLKAAGCEMIKISEEIEKNKDAKGVTVLRK